MFGHNSEINGLISPFINNKALLISSSKVTFKFWDMHSNSLLKTLACISSITGLFYTPLEEFKNVYFSLHNSCVKCWGVSDSASNINEVKMLYNNDDRNNNDKDDINFDINEETKFIEQHQVNEVRREMRERVNESNRNSNSKSKNNPSDKNSEKKSSKKNINFINQMIYNNQNNYINNNYDSDVNMTYNNNYSNIMNYTEINNSLLLNNFNNNNFNNNNNPNINKQTDNSLFSIRVHTGEITAYLVNEKHFCLITGGKDSDIIITSLLNLKQKIISEHSASITFLEQINEDIFISSSNDASIKYYNISNPDKSLFTIIASHIPVNFVYCMKDFYYNTNVLLIGNCEGEVKVFDVVKRKFLSKFKHSGNMRKCLLMRNDYNTIKYDFSYYYFKKFIHSGVILEDNYGLCFFDIVEDDEQNLLED